METYGSKLCKYSPQNKREFEPFKTRWCSPSSQNLGCTKRNVANRNEWMGEGDSGRAHMVYNNCISFI